MTISHDVFNALLDEDWNIDLKGDYVLKGLLILEKYLPDIDLIQGADHDIIYSVDIDEIIEAGITESDAKQLGQYGWHTTDGYLAHYV